MAEQEEEMQFIDADEYQSTPQAALTFEQVVLERIRSCLSERSKEMIGGHYVERPTKEGMKEIYIPDQRSIYISNVTSLYIALINHLDKDFNKEYDNFTTSLETVKEKVKESLNERLKYVEDQRIIRHIREQIVTGIIDTDFLEAKIASDGRLEAYDFLLKALIKLYGRKRYLMAQEIG